MEIKTTADILDELKPGNVTVRVEGYVETERPEGVRPKSIFVVYNSPSVDFQYSISEFNHNGEHYVPSKAGRSTSYRINVSRSELPDSAFKTKENLDGALADLSDNGICGLLYTLLYHDTVLPAYNEWRHRNDLSWGESWGERSRQDNYKPYSLR
jgi:hypothetical protein